MRRAREEMEQQQDDDSVKQDQDQGQCTKLRSMVEQLDISVMASITDSFLHHYFDGLLPRKLFGDIPLACLEVLEKKFWNIQQHSKQL